MYDFSYGLFWVKDLVLFELKHGSHANIILIGGLQRPEVEDLFELMRILTFAFAS